ncbi:MAG: ATP synthase F1 subunit delta [Planctomycetes bacterium]|nr:ATP synthase F1 subunit delta [Planctomycetota bacterium]
MAESFEQQLELADVYAEALFALASAAGQADEVRAELEQLDRLQQIEPGFAEFMRSGALDDAHRAAGLERMFRGRLDDVVLDTLLVMNRHGRCGLLGALARCFVLRLEQAAGQVEVRVSSAQELDQRQREDVVRTAAQLAGKQPLMEYSVDPALIGGLLLQIGDVRYDNSVRQQLQAARARLRERGQRGLAVAVAD